MNTVRCIACQRFSFRRASPEMALSGFGHCEHRAKFIAHSSTFTRECDRYEAESPENVKAREAWLERAKA